MATKLGRMVTNLKKLLPKMLLSLWLHDLVRSRDKLKPLYVHFHKIYDHKTQQDVDLNWVASNH